jgi:hypothetical protein
MGYTPENMVMIYAPREAQEVEIVLGLVEESRRYTAGDGQDASAGS